MYLTLKPMAVAAKPPSPDQTPTLRPRLRVVRSRPRSLTPLELAVQAYCDDPVKAGAGRG